MDKETNSEKVSFSEGAVTIRRKVRLLRPAVLIVLCMLCYAASSLAASGTISSVQTSFPDVIVTTAMEPVVPYEFNYDLRKLPYFALSSSANRLRPYLPLRRPPSVMKQPSAALAPIFPSTYLPSAPMPAPVASFPGLSFNDVCSGGQCGAGWPPDPNGDVGPNHYIQAVNDAYGIYSKTGTLYVSFTENNLWSTSGSNPCNGDSKGDPIVVYDPLGDRWILTHFAFAVDKQGNPVSPYYECIAVSKKSDPVTGGWWLYPLRVDAVGTGHPPVGAMNDYPKFGIWPDCLYMSANEFTGDNFDGVLYAALSRSDLEAGNTLSWTMGFIPYSTYGIFTMIPSTMLGASPSSLPPTGTPNYFVSESQTGFSFEVRTFFTSNNCSTGTFNITPAEVTQATYYYNFGVTVPQPGTANLLDAIGDRLLQKVPYRKIGSSESLWVVHNVMASSSSTVQLQWAQIDVSGGTISAEAVQQEIYAPDTTLYRWMGSLSVDKDGNMALGYSTSNGSAPNYPSIAYSGRLVSDPLGTLPQSETQLVAGRGSQTNNCGGDPCDRWGDYSAMSVDPSDDCTFWYVNEYYSSTANGSVGNWQTRIGAFRFSNCDPNALVKKLSSGDLYPGIAVAYSTITGDDVLEIQSITFYEDLVLDSSYYVALNGGYNSSISAVTGFSAVSGTVTISGGGTVQFSGISIQ